MGRDTQLEVTRNLARIYADVLREPLPAALLELLKRLEAQEAVRRAE
jgi:hypothetical protein